MQCLHERRARLLGSDTGTNQRRYTFQSKIEVIGVGKTDLLGHVSVYIFSVTGIVHPEYRIDDNRLHAYRYTTTGAIVHSRVIDYRTIYDHRRVVGINTSAIGPHVIINYRTGNPAARS